VFIALSFSYLPKGRNDGPGGGLAAGFAPVREASAYWRSSVPSLLRFLTAILVLAGLAGAAIFALATMVEPNTREMTITLPKERFQGPNRP